jgi:hypothetical protein
MLRACRKSPEDAAMSDREKATLDRLEGQISWYDKRSFYNQRSYKVLKLLSMIMIGLVPVLAGFGARAEIGGFFGFVALMCEGLQQLNQYHANWISYRSTCEALKHEKYLYLARAGHYRDVSNPEPLLAEQVESLVSVEHAKWVSTRRDANKKTQDTA